GECGKAHLVNRVPELPYFTQCFRCCSTIHVTRDLIRGAPRISMPPAPSYPATDQLRHEPPDDPPPPAPPPPAAAPAPRRRRQRRWLVRGGFLVLAVAVIGGSVWLLATPGATPRSLPRPMAPQPDNGRPGPDAAGVVRSALASGPGREVQALD